MRNKSRYKSKSVTVRLHSINVLSHELLGTRVDPLKLVSREESTFLIDYSGFAN